VLPEIFALAPARSRNEVPVGGLQINARRCAPISTSARADRVGGRDDAARPHLGRQYAHDVVYDICQQVAATGRPLVDLLAENKEITAHLDRAALEKLCDPANYLGLAGEMVDRVLAMRK